MKEDNILLPVAKSDGQKQLEAQGCVFRGQERLDTHELDPTKECYCGRPNLRKAQGEPVAWLKHGPYDECEPLIYTTEDPHDDDCFTAVYAAPPSSAQLLEELEKERECSARNDAISFDTIHELSEKVEDAQILIEVIELMVSYLKHEDQDANHGWMVQKMREELAAYRSQHEQR